jgi:glycosyltransferase involved in cell wall biosynthesis
MLLSVLTPSRNYEPFLSDTLASVAAQEDSAVEHVVVDGASTDGTVPLLRAWSDRISYLSEPDRGQSDALNKAAAMASGDWYGWLNADEFYLPGVFDAVRAATRRTPRADVVYGDCCLVDVDGRLIRLLPQHHFVPRLLRWYGVFLASCATFIRASALPRRGWDPELRRTMDWDLYLELQRQRARFVYLPVPLAAFRIHDAQVTAVRSTTWEHEGLQVRTRHGLTASPSLAKALYVAGRVDHGLHKLLTGAYSRQARARRNLHGADLRWFGSKSGRDNVELLLRLASRSAVRIDGR